MTHQRLGPRGVREWLHRLRGTLRGGRTDADLREELRAHLEMAADDAAGRGRAPQEAVRSARMQSGNVTQALEALRDQRGLPWIDNLARDLRYGVRMLRRSPAFTLVALFTLALGTGANAAVYQLLDAIRLRLLPVKNPQQLVIVDLADRTRWTGRRTTSYPSLTNPLWEHFRDHQNVLSGVFAWSNEDLRIEQGNGSIPVRGLFVSGDFFNVLGVPPLLGRVFTPADDHDGCGAPGAVVSHAFWQRQLGGDRAVIGRTLDLNTRRVDVIGVTPPGFFGVEVGRAYDVAVPICSHAVLGRERSWLADGTTWWLTVMGRMASGETLDHVNAGLRAASSATFAATLPADYPAANVGDYLTFELRAVPGTAGVSALRSRYSDPLAILLITTGLVLLIACTNLANLILARASAREKELAVRLAIGASWGRLVQQLMVENALLAAGGAAAGVALATMLSRFLIGLLGTGLTLDLHVDARLVGFMLLAASLTCLTFGLIPAWRASRVAARDTMQTSARTMSASRQASRFRQTLVVAQVGLSVVLLFGALLFTATLQNLLAVNPGFRSAGVATVRVDFSQASPPQAGRMAFKRDLLERLRNARGVGAAAEVRHVPMNGTGSSIDVWRDGDHSAARTPVRLNAFSDGYLQLMGISLIAGRDFTERDVTSSSRVAIVNRSFARRLGLPDNPVGERFHTEAAASEPAVGYEIIGLVPDTKYFTLREEFLPIAFVPLDPLGDPRPFTDLMIRPTVPLADVSSAIRQVVGGISPGIRIEVREFDRTIRDGLRRERLMAMLSAFFGGLSGLIAAIGLYGVMSYAVARRTNEIGVRIALGARRGEILTMILREAGVLVATGLAAGSLLALAVADSARPLVFGLQPHDLRPVALACLLLAAVAMAASFIPAWRAATLEPLSALRSD